MLLEELCRYGRRLEEDGELAPSMYAWTPVRWEIPLDEGGRLTGDFVPMVGAGRTAARGKRLLAPHVVRSSGVKAKLLADNAEYVLGIARDEKKRARVDKCHGAFVESVEACVEATDEPAVRAVARFLAGFDRDAFVPPEGFDAGDSLTFRVGDVRPIDLPAVRTFWASSTADSGETVVMECLVCGRERAVEKRLPFKLKGIPGGQSSGTALVSANAQAFESYGLEASLTSPICRECGELFAKAANHLLADEARRLYLGDSVYLFWTREPQGFSPLSFLTRPDPADVAALLASAWTGREAATELDDEDFYAVALSAAGGRVVVRDWIETTVPAVQRSLARFFALQRLVDPHQPDEPRPYGVYALAGATVRDLQKDLVAEVPRQMLRFALTGGNRSRLPDRLLYEAVRRNRAEQGVTRPRAALIKMVLLSQETLSTDQMETHMVALDRSSDQPPAYHCGRLLAVLEHIQDAAIPGAKATLIDRFFGSASSAPASVFGFLLRNAQAHLGKLRKEQRGLFEHLQKQLGEVQGHLTTFPATLPMKEQALFSLGYYHQRAERFQKKSAPTD